MVPTARSVHYSTGASLAQAVTTASMLCQATIQTTLRWELEDRVLRLSFPTVIISTVYTTDPALRLQLVWIVRRLTQGAMPAVRKHHCLRTKLCYSRRATTVQLLCSPYSNKDRMEEGALSRHRSASRLAPLVEMPVALSSTKPAAALSARQTTTSTPPPPSVSRAPTRPHKAAVV